jgi:hypothetical protein
LPYPLNDDSQGPYTARFRLLDRSFRNKSAWSPEGDYFPKGDRLLIFTSSHAEWSAALNEALSVSGVPTLLVDAIRLFYGAVRRDLMEAEVRKAGGHVRR